MASENQASQKGKQPLVPTVVLARGDQVLRKEYPAEKFSIGSQSGADLQFQAAGVPDSHTFLSPSRKGLFVYITKNMDGLLARGDHRVKLSDLIALELLPSKGDIYAVTLQQDMKLSLDFGDHRLLVGFGPKPVEAPLPAKPARTPQLQKKPKLVLNPNFRFADIPQLEDEQHIFFGGLAGIGIVYALVLFALVWAIQFVPERDVMEAAPPPRVVKLMVPEKEEVPPEELTEEEDLTEEEEAPEEEAEEEPEDKKPEADTPDEQAREQAKEQVQKLGLVQVISSQGGAMTKDVSAVMDSLSNVFNTAGPMTANADDADATLQDLQAYGDGSGGIDSDIAGLARVGGGKKAKASAEKVSNPVVTGEAAQDKRRSFAAISATMRRYASGFKVLYNRLLRKFPAARGKISIKFTIKADGSVVKPTIVASNFKKYPDFEQDILKRIVRIRFEAIPAKAGDVRVEFPFVFNP